MNTRIVESLRFFLLRFIYIVVVVVVVVFVVVDETFNVSSIFFFNSEFQHNMNGADHKKNTQNHIAFLCKLRSVYRN